MGNSKISRIQVKLLMLVLPLAILAIVSTIFGSVRQIAILESARALYYEDLKGISDALRSWVLTTPI